MIELSIIILVLNEAENIGLLIRQVRGLLERYGITYEIVVVDGGSRDRSVEIAKGEGARVIIQSKTGFANAILEGFKFSKGEKILTLDCDFSHPPDVIPKMLEKIGEADIVVASRYVKGGSSTMSFTRYFLSRALNLLLHHGLSLPINDITSGFRIYKRKVVDSIKTKSKNFEILPEILIEAYSKGWNIIEMPFCYMPRRTGSSHLKIFKFASGYLMVFLRLWKNRNSINYADYDERGYNSRIFLQRSWHRKRYDIIMGFIDRKRPLADLGCGSSRIIQDLTEAVAVDISLDKLRYIRKSNKYLVNARLGALPFKDGKFYCVICSEVIEHTREDRIFDEMKRILAPQGILVVGTPDYGGWRWRVIEFFYGLLQPGGYRDQHISRYSNLSLKNILTSHGFSILEQKYIYGAELIIKAIKNA